MKKLLAVLLTLAGAIAWAAWSLRQTAQPAPAALGQLAQTEQMTDPAKACRDSAPENPYTEADEKSRAAFESCREAVDAAPKDGQLHFLLGVSALQVSRLDTAQAAFGTAADLEYCAAFAYLGDSAWHRSKDPNAAEQFYRRGADCGDTKASQQLFRPEVFSASAYPAFIEALYRSDTQFLNRAPRVVSAPYVRGFYEALSEQYLGKNFDPAWLSKHFGGGEMIYRLRAAEAGDGSNPVSAYIYSKALPWVYLSIFPEMSAEALETVRESTRKAGHADLIRLVENYPPGSLAAYRTLKGVEAYAAEKQPLIDSIRAIAPEIKSIEDLRRRASQYGRGTELTVTNPRQHKEIE